MQGAEKPALKFYVFYKLFKKHFQLVFFQGVIPRLLIVGGAGTLFYAPGKMVMDADDVPAKLLPGIKSLGEFYLNTLRKENDIDWIFFCLL